MHAHVLSLAPHGYVRGLTLAHNARFYGNLRYALPPLQRWRRARALPASFSYGSLDAPADAQGEAGECPQGGFLAPPDESRWTEDCFGVNVYVPGGKAPESDGGWLQIGSPNSVNPAALLGESPVQAIVVLPAYRLNVFGFLYARELELDAAAAGETPGNHGFWDQRLALEWTSEYGALFGGDVRRITVAGYSAGAHSAFHQLAYDLRVSPAPENPGIISQACLWSNSPIVQPKRPDEAQSQFDALVHALRIDPGLPPAAKVARLRDVPASALVHAALQTGCQYRPVTESPLPPTTTSASTAEPEAEGKGDGDKEPFIPSTLFADIDSGGFARACSARGIRLLLGECRDEPVLYSKWFPPAADSLAALRHRLYAEYPRRAVDALLPLYTSNCSPNPDGDGDGNGNGDRNGDGDSLPAGCDNWNEDVFGRIYADMQVYRMQRGFVAALLRGGFPLDRLFRYRVEMRVKSVDAVMPPEWGVTHASDMAIWFWGNGVGDGVRADERRVLVEGLVGPFARFVSGLPVDWGTRHARQVRTLRADGVVIWEDELWDGALELWHALRDAGALT